MGGSIIIWTMEVLWGNANIAMVKMYGKPKIFLRHTMCAKKKSLVKMIL